MLQKRDKLCPDDMTEKTIKLMVFKTKELKAWKGSHWWHDSETNDDIHRKQWWHLWHHKKINDDITGNPLKPLQGTNDGITEILLMTSNQPIHAIISTHWWHHREVERTHIIHYRSHNREPMVTLQWNHRWHPHNASHQPNDEMTCNPWMTSHEPNDDITENSIMTITVKP